MAMNTSKFPEAPKDAGGWKDMLTLGTLLVLAGWAGVRQDWPTLGVALIVGSLLCRVVLTELRERIRELREDA